MNRNVRAIYRYYFRGYKLVVDLVLPNIAVVSSPHKVPAVIYRMFFDTYTGEVW